jgi:pimeloyl-ACP methyl ester carboxylesterase
VGHWVTAIVGIVLLYVLLAFGASRMLYFPIRYPAGNWTAGQRLGAKDVFIRQGLHGWYFEKPGAELTTLHLHGNGGNITHRLLTAEHVLEAGSSILLLDYRGYGRSSGRPTESGLYEDALAAYDWLKQNGHGRIVLHGESLGTAIAAELATRRRCAGLILEAPFTSASSRRTSARARLRHIIENGENPGARVHYSRR